jgi:hypothetical protein
LPRSWSSDNKFLLCETLQRTMFLWPIAGGKPVVFGSRTGLSRQGRFSPSGRYIAYISDESGRDEVYVQATPPATGRLRVSVNGARQHRWGRTDRELFFTSGDRSMMAVDVRTGDTLAASEPTRLFTADPGLTNNMGFEVVGDGQRFLVPRLLGENTPDTPITVVLNWWANVAKASAGADGISR